MSERSFDYQYLVNNLVLLCIYRWWLKAVFGENKLNNKSYLYSVFIKTIATLSSIQRGIKKRYIPLLIRIAIEITDVTNKHSEYTLITEINASGRNSR